MYLRSLRFTMAEISFEQKVQGLQRYYRALTELDPSNPEHGEVANPDFFYYGEGYHVSSPLQEVKRGVVFDIECHGRREYGNRGLNKKDLREDTDESRIERADVLAVMTAPLTPEVREQRTERIAGILAAIVSGQTLSLTEYDNAPVEVAIDLRRAVFGVFRNGHISDRVLTVQYDRPDTYRSSDYGEEAVAIDVPALFRGNGVRLEPVAA